MGKKGRNNTSLRKLLASKYREKERSDPLPRVDETLDLKSGYWQVEHPADRDNRSPIIKNTSESHDRKLQVIRQQTTPINLNAGKKSFDASNRVCRWWGSTTAIPRT